MERPDGAATKVVTRTLLRNLVLFVVLLSAASVSQAHTLRLFVIGNSFSQNATRYLPQLAREGGHNLIIGRAETGNCSLERDWNASEIAHANPDDPKAKIYGGKTLRECMGAGRWDIVTLQQYSMLSADVTTYRPYAEKMSTLVKELHPDAEIVLHQTWAYRSDSTQFGYVSATSHAQSQQEMWEKSRAAYRQIAAELGVRLIPVGDAFQRINSDPKWGYKKDTTFDFRNPVYPALPDQAHSLNVGYGWSKDMKLTMDTHHASPAGCYLASLVWSGVLFDESPEKLTFVPPGIPSDFAAHLRQVAWDVAQKANKEGKLGATATTGK